MTKYNIFQNAFYIYSKAELIDKKYKYKLILFFLLELVIPVIATFIPTVVVYLITNNYPIDKFVIIVLAVVAGYAFLVYINMIVSYNIEIENTFIRTKSFWHTVSDKTRTTGYENMESKSGQEKLEKAVGAINSNWIGVELFQKRFPVFIVSISGLLLYSSYILSINIWIVILLIAMTILNVLLNFYARNYEKNKMDELNNHRIKLSYFQKEANKLINGKDIRIYKLEDWFYRGIKFFTKKYSKQVLKQKFNYFLPNLSDSIFTIARDVLAYSILVAMVVNKQLNVTQFTFMIGIVTGFTIWLNQLSNSFGGLKEASLSINNFRDYIALDDLTQDHGEVGADEFLDKKLSIEFKNVSFKYPEAEKPTIENLNLKIEPGEKIAIVGVNGAGKTTIVKLLSGLYHPTEGEILINDIPINSFSTKDYFRLIGAIFQDVNTFSFTLAQCISGKRLDKIDYDRLSLAIEKAGLKDKIEKLPKKEKTYLTQELDESGILLSGGEMQKLMLARALYKDAPILILDEPTAALDPLAEEELYLKYTSLTQNKTSLFISHRLSSTQFCDRIIFLENGKIIEEGSHNQLMELNGKYAQMFEIQSQYYKENKQEELEQ